jgi:hypothetical protein
MSTLLNDRDKALQAAIYRSKQTSVSITSTSGEFKTAKNGGSTLAVGTAATSITLIAAANNVYTAAAIYTWHYALSATPTTWELLGTGTTQIVTSAAFKSAVGTSSQIQYRCTVTEPLLDTAYGYFTILYTLEPSEAINVSLTRTNAVLSSDSSGNIASFANTDTTITVSRGGVALSYSDVAAQNSFSVSIDTTQAAGRTANATPTIAATSWTFNGITALSTDGAKVAFIITVYDASGVAVSPTIGRQIVYNKVANGTIGADGANLYPIANYDFTGTTLPTGVTYPGTKTDLDNGTTTTIQNTVVDQNLRLTGLNLVPTNSYIISMRVKFISGNWEGYINYVNPAHNESASYYKVIPQPVMGVWTTINLDMRTLTVGGTEYLTGGNISQLRFDFIQDTASQVAIDYISVGKYGVAEATKYATVTAYAWSNTGSAPARVATGSYTWNTALVDTYPSGYTSYAPAAPGVGYTLYQLSLPIKDVATALTTTVDWNSSAVATNTIGYKVDGSIGPRGQSYRTCYIVTTSGTAPAAPTAAVGDAAPTGWSFIATSTLTSTGGVSQYMYQSDGILTGTPGDLTAATSISWGAPYLSNLKVANLQAISADMGIITAGTLSTGTIFAGALSAATGTFTGALSGATGEFAGTLRAGVLDLTTFAGISYTYTTNAASIVVPAGKTSMRVTLIGAGGGGGGGDNRYIWPTTGGGGGGGGMITQLYSGLSVGATFNIVIGIGGNAGTPADGVYAYGGPATDGGATQLRQGTSVMLSAPGGGGGSSSGPANQAGGLHGGAAGNSYATAGGLYYWVSDGEGGGGFGAPGAKGGNSRFGTGGLGGSAATGYRALVGSGYGAGGGGGGNYYFTTYQGSQMGNNGTIGAAGTNGYAIVEFFDPNTVVLQTAFDTLKSALTRQGIAVT